MAAITVITWLKKEGFDSKISILQIYSGVVIRHNKLI